MMTARRGNSTTEQTAPPQPHDLPPPADPAAGHDRPPPPDRITVALIPKVAEDLHQLQDQTSMSKTDIVNRAISLYKFIEAQRSAGQDVLIRDKSTGEFQVILLI